MKIITFVLALFFSVTLIAQFTPFEKSPNLPEDLTITESRDTFNLQFQFPTAAFVGEYGIESDGQYIYVTQWLDDSIAQYNMNGDVLDVFVIPGVGEVRDLAWDGTYFYGSPNDYKFFVIDMANKTLINTHYTDMKIRGMAYDNDADALWVSEHWSPMFYQLDKSTGATLDSLSPSGITLDAISGLAYDNQSPNGPFLWGFSQDSTGAIIIKYDIPNMTQTGNMIDVSGLASGVAYAGGLYIEWMNGMSDMTIGGMIQNDQVFALELGYANSLVEIEEEIINDILIYPNPVKDQLFIELNKEGDFTIKVYNQLGKMVMTEIIRAYGNTTFSLPVMSLSNGIYFVQLSEKSGKAIAQSFIVGD